MPRRFTALPQILQKYEMDLTFTKYSLLIVDKCTKIKDSFWRVFT